MFSKKQNLIIAVGVVVLALWFFLNEFGLGLLTQEYELYEKINQFHQQLIAQKDITGVYASEEILRYFLFGAVLGTIMITIVYNVILCIKMKDKKYMTFSIFFFLITLEQISLSRIMSAVHLEIGQYLYQHIAVLINSIIIAGIIFIYDYLNVFSELMNFKKPLLLFASFPFLNILLWILDIHFIVMPLTYGFLAIAFLVVLMICMIYIKKQHKTAKILMLSTVILIGGLTINILSALGKISFDLPINAFFISIAITAILLTLSLTEQLFVLHDKNLELRKLEEALTELSLTDELSGLYNRRYFNEKLKYEVDKANQTGKPLSLLLLDIDHFKSFNDNYGHQSGDKAITRIGQIMKENIRQADYACRFGGEEFAIILTETNKYAADKHIAERLHASLAKQVFLMTRHQKVYLTISIGISQLQRGDSAYTLIEHADKALYKAKELGRNRTVLYREDM